MVFVTLIVVGATWRIPSIWRVTPEELAPSADAFVSRVLFRAVAPIVITVWGILILGGTAVILSDSYPINALGGRMPLWTEVLGAVLVSTGLFCTLSTVIWGRPRFLMPPAVRKILNSGEPSGVKTPEGKA